MTWSLKIKEVKNIPLQDFNAEGVTVQTRKEANNEK
jgi:hypothetical protein